MWTNRHRTRHETRLKNIVMQAGLDERKPHWPSLRPGPFDSVFQAKRCEEWCNVHGLRRRVVEKHPDQKGFVVLERRWVVERTFGSFRHWGGLLRERAGRLDVATARLACVACLMAASALNNPA